MKIPHRFLTAGLAIIAMAIGGAMLWRRVHPSVAAKSPLLPEQHCDADGRCTQSPAHADWRGDSFRGLPALAAPAAAIITKPPSKRRAKPPKKPLTKPPLTNPVPVRPALDADDAAALAHARKLQGEGKYEQAKAAFIQATGRGQTVHLRPLAEYAYAMLSQGDENRFDDVESMLLTSTKDDDPELQAQAWFNLALLYRKKNAVEPERAALARSLARREHAIVRAKLNERSGCVAEIGARFATVNVAVATGWKGVCAQLGLCTKSERLTAKQARERSCVTWTASAGAPDESHGCTGDGPWESSFGHSLYRFTKAWIAQRAKNRFIVVKSGEGGWPAICQGLWSTSCEQSGDYAIVSQQYEPMSALPGRPTPQSEERDAVCLQAPKLTTTAIFSLSSTKLLAAVAVVAGQPVQVALDAEGRRLKLAGGGCNGYVPLDASMRFVPLQGR